MPMALGEVELGLARARVGGRAAAAALGDLLWQATASGKNLN